MAMAISSIINLGSCATVGFSRRGLQEQANPNQLSSLVQADDARHNGRQECIIQSVPMRRREALVSLTTCLAAALVASELEGTSAFAVSLPKEEAPKLCDSACEKELENLPMMTTGSGLQYKDIKVGNGPTPPIGYQVAANYVAMVPSGDIFDSSLTKGLPYIFRVGSGQVIKGLDEGILSMKVGGKRRLYIPGQLAFPKGLSAAAGRPRVPPSSPVVFDVSLEYIPGFDDSED